MLLNSLIEPASFTAQSLVNSSMRVANSSEQQNFIGSTLALNSNTSSSTQNLNSPSSASFKFSLINTVRKAFKKDKNKDYLKDKEATASNANNTDDTASMTQNSSNKPAFEHRPLNRTSTVSTVPFNSYNGSGISESTTNSHSQTLSSPSQMKMAERTRSSTLDSVNTYAVPAPTSLQSLKQQQKIRKGSKESKLNKVIFKKLMHFAI